MKRAVFLDRDGVINRAYVTDGVSIPPRTLLEVEILDGVVESIAMLKAAKFEIVVVTNQPDVARGVTTKEFVESVHLYLGTKLDIQEFYTCFHDNNDDCECRKPKDGLLRKAARELGIDLSRSYLVGDRWRDIGAGQTAGCRCYFIDYSYAEPPPEMPFTRVFSLAEATLDIIGAS
jgi:D-glycero-D-manno-heptose 1,7-bisphosphate phosphatase